MSGYKKYIMMGLTTVLLPLAKRAFSKIMSKYTAESEQDSTAEENEEFTSNHQPVERRA